MSSNSEIEMRWVDAWNELYEIIGPQQDVPCQLPDWSVVDIEDCKAWLQKSVYEGYLVQVQAVWVGYKKGVMASRSLAGPPSDD